MEPIRCVEKMILPVLAVLALAGCTTGNRYSCPDDNLRFGSDDPCYVEESYRIEHASYRPAASLPAVPLMESALSGTHPTSITILYEADTGAKACNGEVRVEFPREPALRDTVRVDGFTLGGYRWAQYPDRFPGVTCPDSASPAGAGAYITLVSDRKVGDDEGPENGRETTWAFHIEWSGRRIDGTLRYSRRMVHHG